METRCIVVELPEPETKSCEDCGAPHTNRYKCEDCMIEQAIADGVITGPSLRNVTVL